MIPFPLRFSPFCFAIRREVVMKLSCCAAIVPAQYSYEQITQRAMRGNGPISPSPFPGGMVIARPWRRSSRQITYLLRQVSFRVPVGRAGLAGPADPVGHCLDLAD